jgi:hypothetical protein
MKQYQSENHIGQSAIKAGIDPKTAGKYLKGAPGPEEQAQAGERYWRTHPDAFAQVWPGVEEMLLSTLLPERSEFDRHACTRGWSRTKRTGV